MRKSITDRNILFGIFALQMGFITRGALVTAMKTWVLNKNKPLSQILREQDAIAADTFALLDALVQKHLALHGHDPSKSLAAISALADEVLDELERISDSDVQGSLAQAGAAPTIDLPRETTIKVAVGASSSRGLRFRILRPHARGGLGLVYVAHDEELNRDVALKEIQDRHADHPESRSRFMLEAEITGGLEHPGIVPVYGLGQYADGRPFYAMRFIRGDSLKDAITKFHGDARPWPEKTLELRELLERLIDVCNAMQYAHDRGVLHRDLKPGNIMLGKYGETLVVDWGLAKPLGAAADPDAPSLSEEPMLRPSSASGSAATMQGSAVGTPQYMSPEQAAGRLDQLGPASDIYSLGATLYSLLTGQAPFETEAGGKADLAALLKRVQAGDFRAPRQLKPEISPPLEAICLKAMAQKPADRYANPRALIDDIKHWLADEPVNAWPDPWTVKTRRWMARHRPLVTGIAAALLVGIVSLSAATVLLAQANEVIQKSNDDLTSANRLIQKQNDDIKKEITEKEKQRKLAESRLRQSLDAVGLFANDARRYCEDAMVPGDSRRRLYEVLITQLERQVDQEPGEASIDSLRNKVWMYQTLCAVTHDFGQYAESKKWFTKGIASVEQWRKLRPGDPLALGFRAALLNLRANSLKIAKKTG
ncbi:MAG: serine/threonine protein kinase [Planctomycetes bacterium]|nr:serine/threonine protein kinase [Planctomycetota bacterium]